MRSRPPEARELDGLRFWLLAIGAFLAIESCDRIALAVWNVVSEGRFQAPLLVSLFQGMADDAGAALTLGAPFLLGLYALAPLWRRRWARAGAHVLLYALLCVLAFTEIAELFFWNEFDSRFNSIAVNYLLFPREVIGNLRESFNLPLLLPIVFVVAGLLYLLLRRAYARGLVDVASSARRWRMVGFAAATFAGGLLVSAAVPDDHFEERGVNEIAKNGFHSLIHAALTNDAEFDGLFVTIPQDEANTRLRRLVAQDNTRFIDSGPTRGIERHVDNGTRAKRLNVVLVIEESFGSIYVDGLDNRSGESISPRLSALAQDGLFFTNIYATGNRTVRGLEALITSFPPIPGIATTRRAGSEGMNSLPFLLERFGYRTAFLYGGRASFDNMGHYWSTVGFDRVLQQKDIRDIGFSTIWGAADEYLFTEALARMDEMTARGEPVFLSLLTVSNHRPYVYPEGRIAKDPKLKRKENSATYADWAFGDFVERARGHAWFDDTIFVFIGDHGPRVYGAAQVPVPSYRVPLLFYAPRHVQAARNETLGSSMDMAPTLLGLLGLSYDSPFFGVDLRHVPPGGGRVAIEHNFSVALGDGHSVAMLLPGRQQRGWEMAPGPVELRPLAAPEPELARDTAALYQTAHRLFYAHGYHALGEPVAHARKP